VRKEAWAWRMNDIFKRSLTGFIYAAVIVGSVIWSFYSLAIVFGVSSLLCSWEFLNAYSDSKV